MLKCIELVGKWEKYATEQLIVCLNKYFQLIQHHKKGNSWWLDHTSLTKTLNDIS